MRQPSYPISYNLSCTLHPVNNQPSIALLKNRPTILAKSHIQYCWLLRNLLFNYVNYLWCTSLFSHFWSVFWCTSSLFSLFWSVFLCTFQFIQSFMVSLLMYQYIQTFLVSLWCTSIVGLFWYSVQVWVFSVFSGQFLMFFYSFCYALLLFLIVGPFQ